MLRALLMIFALVAALPAFAHSDSKLNKGPNGGHIVDAGNQHWELVASGKELTLFVTDADDQIVRVDSGTARAKVLIEDKTYTVDLKPAGGNTLKGSGEFDAAKGMKVIVSTDNVGGQSFQARLTPKQ